MTPSPTGRKIILPPPPFQISLRALRDPGKSTFMRDWLEWKKIHDEGQAEIRRAVKTHLQFLREVQEGKPRDDRIAIQLLIQAPRI
jgi:hypothetical protein